MGVQRVCNILYYPTDPHNPDQAFAKTSRGSPARSALQFRQVGVGSSGMRYILGFYSV